MGKSSYDIQKQYIDKSKLIIAGNPKYSFIKGITKSEFVPKKASIFFSVPSYNEGNMALLEIIRDFIRNHPEISFTITAHPMNDINLFSSKINLPNVTFADKRVLAGEILKEDDFVILYNTTVTIEALNYHIPILRYNGRDFISLWQNKSDTFQTLNDLERLFSNLHNKAFFSKLLSFYNKILKNTFYFEDKKEISDIYHDNIIKRIR